MSRWTGMYMIVAIRNVWQLSHWFRCCCFPRSPKKRLLILMIFFYFFFFIVNKFCILKKRNQKWNLTSDLSVSLLGSGFHTAIFISRANIHSFDNCFLFLSLWFRDLRRSPLLVIVVLLISIWLKCEVSIRVVPQPCCCLGTHIFLPCWSCHFNAYRKLKMVHFLCWALKECWWELLPSSPLSLMDTEVQTSHRWRSWKWSQQLRYQK